MWTLHEVIAYLQELLTVLKKMEKNQEVLIEKDSQIIALLTPPEFGSASFVVGQPKPN